MRLEEYKNEKSEYSRPPFSAQPHPWLVICHGYDMQKQTFFSISENRYYVRTIPELQNKRIRAYAHEWLVLQDIDSGDCYLWNSISMDKIQLPPLPEYYRLKCLLSAPPYDHGCRVLFLINGTPGDDTAPTLYFCKPGYDQEFHKQELQLIVGDNDLQLWTIFKGKFYGLTFQRSILLHLDLDDDLGTVTVTPMVNQPPHHKRDFLDMPRYGEYLLQSSCDDNNMLLYVYKLCFGRNLEEVYGFLVFRFDFFKKAWVTVKSIGETAIFLGNYWGTTCSTRGTNLNRESIYFTKSRYLYIFNLETQSISVSLPCPHVSKTNSPFYWLTLPSQCNRGEQKSTMETKKSN